MVGAVYPGIASNICVPVAGTVMGVLPCARDTDTPFPLASTAPEIL